MNELTDSWKVVLGNCLEKEDKTIFPKTIGPCSSAPSSPSTKHHIFSSSGEIPIPIPSKMNTLKRASILKSSSKDKPSTTNTLNPSLVETPTGIPKKNPKTQNDVHHLSPLNQLIKQSLIPFITQRKTCAISRTERALSQCRKIKDLKFIISFKSLNGPDIETSRSFPKDETVVRSGQGDNRFGT